MQGGSKGRCGEGNRRDGITTVLTGHEDTFSHCRPVWSFGRPKRRLFLLDQIGRPGAELSGGDERDDAVVLQTISYLFSEQDLNFGYMPVEMDRAPN